MSHHQLLIAANTLWVVVAAVLVMFMQAGFAFLEAGLTRMKNAAHIAGKNVLIFGLASLVYWLVGFGLAFGDGNGLLGTHGFAPSIDALLAVGKAPYTAFVGIPGAAGWLFEVVFAGVSLAIVWGAMAERTKLWVYFAFWRDLHRRHTRSSPTGSGRPAAGCSASGCGLRGLDGRHYRAHSPRSPARSCSARGSASSATTGARTRSRATTCRTPCSRTLILWFGWFGFNRLDPRRRDGWAGRLLRLRRADHEPRRGSRWRRWDLRRVARPAQAGRLDDAERRPRGARGGDRRVRVRRPLGRGPDRLRRGGDRGRRGATRRAARHRRPDRGGRGARPRGRLGDARYRAPRCPRACRHGRCRPRWASVHGLAVPARGAGARPRRRRRLHVLRVLRLALGAAPAVGIRVEQHVETAGLDVAEHGMWAIPSSTSGPRRLRDGVARPPRPCARRPCSRAGAGGASRLPPTQPDRVAACRRRRRTPSSSPRRSCCCSCRGRPCSTS